MKTNFSLTVCYFIYLGLAFILLPVKNSTICPKNNDSIQQVKNEDQALATKKTEFLQSDLLFRY